MKLTETQRNFKKQMANIKPKEKSIYDTGRSGGNPFRDEVKIKRENHIVTRFILFSIIPISIWLIQFAISHVAPTSTVKSPLAFATTTTSVAKSSVPVEPTSVYPPTTSMSAPSVSNGANKKPVSKADAAYLDSFTLISNNSEVISKQNLIPVEQRDQSLYKAELLNAIVLCDNETKRLSRAKPSAVFKPIATITLEYIASRRNAYKYYLDYISTRNNSDNDLGNKYLTMGNQNVYDYTLLLTQIFEINNYEYTDLGNGHWNYSVEK